jgi:pyruvyl transferase EpsO
MTSIQKILELQNIIQEKLTPLIISDYIFLDLPYFPNIGDTLIWQGTLDFLKNLPYKCLYSSSIENYRNPKINEDIIILLMGGGNFGDLWYRHNVFRKKILQSFPDNKIIQLPQSIYFKEENILQEDAKVFLQHKNLTLCLRDKYSLDIANKYFSNSQNILVPDMAFFMDLSNWSNNIKPTENRILFLNRNDSEKNHNQCYDIIPQEAEIRDWPTMEKRSVISYTFSKIQYILKKIDRICSSNLNNFFSDLMYKKYFRKYFIKNGISFLSHYSYIYTTRLHVGILSVLLGKKFSFFDNSYGKNKGFYETWLKDVDAIKFEIND